jgi:hypothetical protein
MIQVYFKPPPDFRSSHPVFKLQIFGEPQNVERMMEPGRLVVALI